MPSRRSVTAAVHRRLPGPAGVAEIPLVRCTGMVGTGRRTCRVAAAHTPSSLKLPVLAESLALASSVVYALLASLSASVSVSVSVSVPLQMSSQSSVSLLPVMRAAVRFRCWLMAKNGRERMRKSNHWGTVGRREVVHGLPDGVCALRGLQVWDCPRPVLFLPRFRVSEMEAVSPLRRNISRVSAQAGARSRAVRTVHPRDDTGCHSGWKIPARAVTLECTDMLLAGQGLRVGVGRPWHSRSSSQQQQQLLRQRRQRRLLHQHLQP